VWIWRSFLRFSPLAADEGAVSLVEALLSEGIGRRIDEVAPGGFRNGPGPAYPELREFFVRFAPDVASYMPRRRALPGSLERLRTIQLALCARLAADNPATLGRCGQTLLAREWKEMEAELPHLDEARQRLARAPEGKAVESECRSELRAILGKTLGGVREPETMLELRRSVCEALEARVRERCEDH